MSEAQRDSLRDIVAIGGALLVFAALAFLMMLAYDLVSWQFLLCLLAVVALAMPPA